MQVRPSEAGAQALFDGDQLALDIRPDPGSASGGGDFEIAARVARLTMPANGPLGLQPPGAEITALLRGVGHVGSQPGVARLKEWEAGGGRLELKNAEILQGAGRARAQGTIGLNGNGRIVGAMLVTASAANFERLAQLILGEGGRAKVAQALARPGDHRAGATPDPSAQPQKGAGDLRSIDPSSPLTPNAGAREVSMSLDFINGAIFLGSVLIGQTPILY